MQDCFHFEAACILCCDMLSDLGNREWRKMPDSDKPPPDSIKPRGWPRRILRAIDSAQLSQLEWIGRHNAGVLIALLIIVLAVWAFVALAHKVVAGGTLSFDETCLRALRRADDPAKPIGPGWLAEVARDVTALGGVTVLTLLTLAVAGFLRLQKMYGAMWLVVLSALGGLAASSLLKSFFERPRPSLVAHLDSVYTSSFPSGHSMLSATIYLTLGVLLGRFVEQRTLKAYFLIVALLLTFLVGVSRVYLGVHYPTDVLAGWAVGLTWALVCWLIARYLQGRGTVETMASEPEQKSIPEGSQRLAGG
jgi:undecaprenyl-diphosphatase